MTRSHLPKGAIGYILESYKGTSVAKSGHGVARRFSWIDTTGKSWSGGTPMFAEHLKDHFALAKAPSNEVINRVLRTRGKQIAHRSYRRHSKRVPLKVAAKFAEKARNTNGVITWDVLNSKVAGALEMLPDTPEARAFLGRVGVEAWKISAGMTH